MLGVVVHEHLAYPEFTPYENLRFFGQMYGVDNLEARCKTLLGEVGLSRFIHEPLHIFSTRHDTTFYDCQGTPP